MRTISHVADHAAVAGSGQQSSQKQTAPAGRTLNVWAAASQALWRWYQGGRIRRTLDKLSDRALADVGFERENLGAQIAARLDAVHEVKREQARIHRELMAYSDAELDDIGIKRGDIPAVARGDKPLEFKVSNPATTISQPTPAANDRYHIAAA